LLKESNYPSIIEALLFASDTPLSINKLKAVLDELSDDKIKGLVEALNRKYEENNQSFTIREIAEGYQMYTRPEYAPWINQLYSLKKAQRLSHAGLETLAIIAYRQPVVKSTIDQIRGVDSGGVIHTLLERKFITILGREESAGRPLIYGTTEEFLVYFGLKDLKDLPRIEELESLLQAKEKKENSIFSTEEVEERIKELNLEGSLAINLPSEGIKEEL
jgi:segregation and condensation protein B